MSTETEPTPYMNIYHLTDARARCIAHRVVRHVLEQLRTADGDLEAALEHVAAAQGAADRAWEGTVAEWDRQHEAAAAESAAWRARICRWPNTELRSIGGFSSTPAASCGLHSTRCEAVRAG